MRTAAERPANREAAGVCATGRGTIRHNALVLQGTPRSRRARPCRRRARARMPRDRGPLAGTRTSKCAPGSPVAGQETSSARGTGLPHAGGASLPGGAVRSVPSRSSVGPVGAADRPFSHRISSSGPPVPVRDRSAARFRGRDGTVPCPAPELRLTAKRGCDPGSTRTVRHGRGALIKVDEPMPDVVRSPAQGPAPAPGGTGHVNGTVNGKTARPIVPARFAGSTVVGTGAGGCHGNAGKRPRENARRRQRVPGEGRSEPIRRACDRRVGRGCSNERENTGLAQGAG